MRLTDQVVLATAVFSLFSSASPLIARDGSVIVHQVDSGNPRAHSIMRLQRVMKKYDINHPVLGYDHMAQTTVSTVAATPDPANTEYTVPVTVGGVVNGKEDDAASAQVSMLDFDTGSSDLWVRSTLEADRKEGDNHTFTDPKTLTEVHGASWNISYGDGSGASGVVYTGMVSVGTATVSDQAVELAKVVSEQFQNDTSNSGLLGLGFKVGNTIVPTPMNPFFDNVKGTLPMPLFSVDLKCGAPGSYAFGAIDSAYANSLIWVPVNNTLGYWQVTTSGYSVGEGTSMIALSRTTILDTGTSYILEVSEVVVAYYKAVPGSKLDQASQVYIFPCVAKLPDYYAQFGAFRARVPGVLINAGPFDNTFCTGGLQISAPGSVPEAIHGDVFLQAIYTVFKAPGGGVEPTAAFAQKPDAKMSGPSSQSNAANTPSGGGSPPSTATGHNVAISPDSGYGITSPSDSHSQDTGSSKQHSHSLDAGASGPSSADADADAELSTSISGSREDIDSGGASGSMGDQSNDLQRGDCHKANPGLRMARRRSARRPRRRSAGSLRHRSANYRRYI